MAKSVRISDEVYEQALTCAALMHRSLNQQIEYWVALGQMVEKEMTGDALMAAMVQRGHAQDEDAVKAGRLRQEDLYAFKSKDVKKMEVLLSADAMENFKL